MIVSSAVQTAPLLFGGSTGKKVFAYLAPGGNVNYVGYSDDRNVIHALFLARDNGRAVMGYTNSSCRIEWLDY